MNIISNGGLNSFDRACCFSVCILLSEVNSRCKLKTNLIYNEEEIISNCIPDPDANAEVFLFSISDRWIKST